MPKSNKWKIKAAIQNIISLLPFSIFINHMLQRHISNAFSPESMLNSYRIQVKHIVGINKRKAVKNLNILEIGPGWYSISGLVFWLLNSGSIYWVDTRRNFQLDLTKKYASALLSIKSEVAIDIGVDETILKDKLDMVLHCQNDEEFFSLCKITYDAPGDARSLSLENSSLDLIYSYGVLEHIPWDVICEIFHNSKLQLATMGRHYHNVGLHDHFHSAGLGNGVNFLKYSEFQWKLIAGNKFAYHNRKRRIDYLNLIKECNLVITYQKDELLEINLEILEDIHIHSDFKGYSKEELAYSHTFLECEKV